MYKVFFVSCFFVLFTLVTIGVSNIYADEESYHIHAADEAYKLPNGKDVVYPDVHGDVHDWVGFDDKVNVHVHGIVYATDDPDSNSHTAGNYTLVLTVSEPEVERPPGNGPVFKKWGRAGYKPDVYAQGSFSEGVHEERDITFDIKPRKKINFDTKNIGWTASATIELLNSLGEPEEPVRDYDEKRINEREENPDWEDGEDAQGNANPAPGIYLADSSQTPQPGDSVTLNIVTSEPYYDISLYVHTPWDPSSSGTYQDYAYGDGTSTETSFTYTFPSGAMHTGNFLFRAVIHRSSDMSRYEETYTVTVDMTPDCSDCTDGNISCPNADAH